MTDTTPKVTENIFLDVPLDIEEENWAAGEHLIAAAQDALSPATAYGRDERKAGQILALLFDGELVLRTPTDFARAALMAKEAAALSAYARTRDAEWRRRALALAATEVAL